MATQVEKAIAKGKSLLGSHAYDNYCQRFVRVCYEAAGIYGSAASATEACQKWRVSKSKNNIPVGAAVYYSNNNQYGHVAIYIGNNQIIHAWAGVQITSINRPSGYLGWGWQGGKKPTGAGSNASGDLSEDSKDSADEEEKTVELCSTSIASTVTVGGALNENKYINIQSDGESLYELHIINNGIDYQPLMVGEATWTTEWKDVAGKFEFTILKDNNLNIQEGNAVAFLRNGKGVFYGYLFQKSRGKGNEINCIAYDQLRYLKNKDTICYKQKTLTDVVTMIAEDYRLKIDNSKMTDTKYLIPGRIEDNESLFDIIKNARDITEQATGKLYIVYDDYGLLRVSGLEDLKTDYLVDSETAEDFSYKTSIDDEVYNQIQFYKDDDTTGNRAKYIYRNNDLINQWGILQLTCKLENGDSPETFGKTVLNLYAQKKRELEVQEGIGDIRLRAGASVFVNLNLGDVIYQNCQVIITKAVHKFGPKYTCNLTLLGGEPYIG